MGQLLHDGLETRLSLIVSALDKGEETSHVLLANTPTGRDCSNNFLNCTAGEGYVWKYNASDRSIMHGGKDVKRNSSIACRVPVGNAQWRRAAVGCKT